MKKLFYKPANIVTLFSSVKAIVIIAPLMLMGCTAGDNGASTSSGAVSSNGVVSSSSDIPASSIADMSSQGISSQSVSSSASSEQPLVQLKIEEQGPGFCAANGVVATEHLGYDGPGYIDSDNVVDARVSWTVVTGNDNAGVITLRFANGSDNARPAKLVINDNTAQAQTINFFTTGSWSTWQNVEALVTLPPGDNIIELRATTGNGLANIDSLTLAAQSAIAKNCFTEYTAGGQNDMHDPSTILKENGVYWSFGTGDGIVSRYSFDLKTWHEGPTVFTPGTWPSWVSTIVKNFAGHFWAPDIVKMNGRYFLYYSTFFATGNDGDYAESAIGVAVTDSLNNPNWQDLGVVVDSISHPRNANRSDFVNCIDAGVYRDANGNVWMTYGSHFGGIYTLQLNPETAKPVNNQRIPIAGGGTAGVWTEYEAAQIHYINGKYYLFINLGDCCAGADSNYLIMVGRSDNPDGPFLTRDGVNFYGPDLISQQDVVSGVTTGATLASDGIYIGPGHFGYLNNYGQDLASIHYYDGRTADGWPSRIDLLKLTFDDAGWPVLSRNFNLVAEPPALTAPSGLVKSGEYTIRYHAMDNYVIDLANCNPADGTNAGLWSDLNNTCQRWHFKQLTGGYYSIHPDENTTSTLEVAQASNDIGANVQIWNGNGGANQQFELSAVAAGAFNIIARHSGLCLTLDADNIGDGTNLVQANCSGMASQVFNIR